MLCNNKIIVIIIIIINNNKNYNNNTNYNSNNYNNNINNNCQFPYRTINNVTLRSAPFVPGPAMDSALGKKLDDLKKASESLQLISAYDVLVLLCASCSAPKLVFVIRSSPYAGNTLLSDIDCSLRLTLSNITNVNITDIQWRQANPPIKVESIGVWSVISIAPSTFLASSTSATACSDPR